MPFTLSSTRWLERLARPVAVPPGWPVEVVWCAPVAVTDALASLAADERRRLAALRRPGDRVRFATGRLLARTLLAARLGGAPADVPLAVDRGRPVVALDGLSVSIAHAGAAVVVAVAADVDVGVDVEPRASATHATTLLDSICTPRERALATAAERAEAFLAAWTRKEALLKATGHGLTVAMTALELAPDGRVLSAAAPLPEAERLAVCDLALDAAHRAALAIVRPA